VPYGSILLKDAVGNSVHKPKICFAFIAGSSRFALHCEQGRVE
jgi:hypothetical protein